MIVIKTNELFARKRNPFKAATRTCKLATFSEQCNGLSSFRILGGIRNGYGDVTSGISVALVLNVVVFFLFFKFQNVPAVYGTVVISY